MIAPLNVYKVDFGPENKRRLVMEAQELIRQAHTIWDNSITNLAFGNLTDEMRNDYTRRTYDATRKTQEALKKLDQAIADEHDL